MANWQLGLIGNYNDEWIVIWWGKELSSGTGRLLSNTQNKFWGLTNPNSQWIGVRASSWVDVWVLYGQTWMGNLWVSLWVDLRIAYGYVYG